MNRSKIVSVTGIPIDVDKGYIEASRGNKDILIRACPSCGGVGWRVLKSNVGNHVDAKYWSLLDNNFWFCPNRDCDVVYYNNSRGLYFLKGEVNVPVFHKETHPSRPVCYCLNVTEAMIREEIYVKGCCDSLEEIVAYTKAGTGRWCPITNPSGKCCRDYLEPLVEGLIKEKPTEVLDASASVLRALHGKPAVEGVRKVKLKVYGMTCEGCASAVRAALEGIGGVDIDVSLEGGIAVSSFPLSVNTTDIIKTIRDSGYDAIVIEEEQTKK